MPTRLKEKIKSNPQLKTFIHHLLIHPVKTRPRRWLRWCRFIYIRRGQGSVIYRNTRTDVVPFNAFSLGACSVIESFSTVNNMVGDVIIGSHSRVGLGNTIIGPVRIGNNVNLAQGIVVSGLNHNYTDPSQTIISQGVTTPSISIQDDVWIGSNTVILAGVTIGRHSVIAAGSIVTRDVAPLTLAGGCPARPLKQYDPATKTWQKITKSEL